MKLVKDAPFISACIIARDAEATIGRSIFTAKRIADEVVVVLDTKTRDATREKAEKAGARVIDRDFDDFAGQRNASIEAALGTWCFILDSDEWLDDAGEIKAALAAADEDVDALAIPFQYADGSPNFIEGASLQVRCVRRDRVRYRFPAHHQLVGVRRTIACNAMIMENYTPAQVEHSARRAIERLTPLLASEDKDERQHALHFITRSHSMLQDWAKTIEFGETCAKEFPENASSWLTLIAAYERSDGLVVAGHVVHRAVAAHPMMRELRWWAARVQIGIMIDMAGRPDPYALIPTRESRYMPHFQAALPFFMMSKVKPEDASEPSRVVRIHRP